jgi:hypothetical protein
VTSEIAEIGSVVGARTTAQISRTPSGETGALTFGSPTRARHPSSDATKMATMMDDPRIRPDEIKMSARRRSRAPIAVNAL